MYTGLSNAVLGLGVAALREKKLTTRKGHGAFLKSQVCGCHGSGAWFVESVVGVHHTTIQWRSKYTSGQHQHPG